MRGTAGAAFWYAKREVLRSSYSVAPLLIYSIYNEAICGGDKSLTDPLAQACFQLLHVEGKVDRDVVSNIIILEYSMHDSIIKIHD